jgi:hypothetical protein
MLSTTNNGGVSSLFTLGRLLGGLSGPWKLDQYNEDGASPGNFEAILATINGTLPFSIVYIDNNTNQSKTVMQAGYTNTATLISPGGDESVEGGLRVVVDAYGAFGSSAYPATDAIFNPSGVFGAKDTTYESAVFLRSADGSSFLSEGYIGSSGGLPAVNFTSVSASSAVSSFVYGNLYVVLTQTVQDRVDSTGTKVGSVLVQKYQITNIGSTAADFSLVRYLDGDLYYSGWLGDDWGGANTTDRSMSQQLFEFDTGDDPNNPTTLIAIRAFGGSVPSNYFEIDRYSGLLYRIINGTPLDNTIAEDSSDSDLVTDYSYDVTLAMQRDFHLLAHEVTQYVTVTEFGLGTTGETPIAPIAEEKTTGRLDFYDFNYQYGVSFESNQLVAHIRVDLVGDAPIGPHGEDLAAIWEAGIESAWNGQYEIADGINHYPIVIDVEWVDANADYVVTVHSGNGNVNATNFYTGNPSGWGFERQGIIAAHEAGHWLGLYDEYNPMNGGNPAWWPLYDTAGNQITGFWDLYDGVNGNPLANWPQLSTNADMNALMAHNGEMESRYYQALVDWLANETSRTLVLAEAPTFTSWEPMDGFTDPPPISQYDNNPLTATINQAPTQSDPTAQGQVVFRVVFSAAVSDFTAADVTVGGTAPGPRNVAVAPVGIDGTTYDVTITGMTGRGTVVATLAADVAHDAFNTGNQASTSTDNVVTYAPKVGMYFTSVFAGEALSGSDQDLILETSEYLMVTCTLYTDNPVVSRTFKLDGKTLAVDMMGRTGPDAYGNYSYWHRISPQKIGTHTYQIMMIDSKGNTLKHEGSFYVSAASTSPAAPAGPTMSFFDTHEAIAGSNGNLIIESSDRVLFTWVVNYGNPIKPPTIKIDGKAPISPIYGYFDNFACYRSYYCSVAPLSAGKHSFEISAADSKGKTTVRKGEFIIVAGLVLDGQAVLNGAAPLLSTQDVNLIGAEALRRLSDVYGQRAAILQSVSIEVADLGGDLLGLAADGKIYIDDDAAGRGWFIDPTPWDDAEFERLASGVLSARVGGGAEGRADLLTAVMHEMEHLLGRVHVDDMLDLMADSLTLGQRRLPVGGV